MSISHQITRAINDGSGSISKTEVYTTGLALILDELIPTPSTDLAVAFAFALAKLQSIFIVVDQDLTLKTNSSGSPQETINLVANKPLVWTRTNSYFAAPFAGNVTGLYVTTLGAAATLRIRASVDPT